MAQLLSSLPIGAKVKFGKYSVEGESAQDITWVIIDKNHASTPAYPTNSVTLLAEKIVDLRAFDAAEPNSNDSYAKQSGLPRYELSNIRKWLNSSAGGGSWYSATHTFDQSPTSSYVTYYTPYNNRPGFLSAFTDDEKNAILSTDIRYYDYNKGLVVLTDKVFLLSQLEVTGTDSGLPHSEGVKFSYFSSNSTVATLTPQAYAHSLCTNKPGDVTTACMWWTRSGISTGGLAMRNAGLGASWVSPNDGSIGVRPALNLPSTIFVTDTTDSDGSYSTIFNTAPPKPDTLNTPTTIYGGKTNTISWTKVTDPDGDAVTYQLECSINGGAYTQIYNGAALSYAHLVPLGMMVVSYRVKATDPSGESSDYTTSPTLMPVDNYPPEISGSDSNLGVKMNGFTGTYYISDANYDTVTVTEAIDGVRIRSLVATLGQVIQYGVTGNTWLALPNGSHTLTISATDGIDTTVRTYTFTKMVDLLEIQNERPWDSSTIPTRIMVVVTRNIPIGASFTVEVCNNGHDTSPTWEDATAAVESGMVHVFSNKSKTSTSWGVRVRVTVYRNGATGACYVSAIGGNFE